MAEFLSDIKIPPPFHQKPLSIMSIYSEVLLLMLFIHSTMRPICPTSVRPQRSLFTMAPHEQ